MKVENTALCLEKYHKDERHLCLLSLIFNKLSKYVCLINNTHISICQMWLQVMELQSILLCLLGICIHYWRIYMSEVKMSSPKFHRMWSVYTFWYVNILNVSSSYWRFYDLIMFFLGIFIYYILLHVWNVTTSPNFYKLFVTAEDQRWKDVH